MQKIRDAAANGNIPDKVLTNDEKCTILKSFLADGTKTTYLSPQQQARHIAATKGKNKSYFNLTYDELQKIVKEKAGTGIIHITYNQKMDDVAIKEIMQLDSKCAVNVDPEKGTEELTDRATMHYGKKSSHIVPAHNDD